MSDLLFNSRRSDVHATHGMVSSSQPLASQIGLDILKKGGNAADAAVAVAASLNVTEPTSTGIGGDAFCLFYSAKEKKVYGLNGSGRSPKELSFEKALKDLGSGVESIPITSPHAITIPGACAAMVDTVSKFGSGKFNLNQIFEGAIQLAEEGYPVSDITANMWKKEEALLLSTPNGYEMLKDGHAPQVGEIMNLPNLAKTYRRVAKLGKKGFYEGPIAQAIVDTIKQLGGVMSFTDLSEHETEEIEPISYCYQNKYLIYECPPNGQGLTALIALGILDVLQEDKKIPDLYTLEKSSPIHIHAMIEALRIAFADTRWHVTDPNFSALSAAQFLDKNYLRSRSKLFDPTRAAIDVNYGSPLNISNTVYFSVVDGEGNACSFIMSNYIHFGSGQVPKGYGFTLQNRGCNFSLNPEHPNRIEPGKRPYHTIIPSIALYVKTKELFMCFGVMGAFMQPQGHVQVLMNIIHNNCKPQKALDLPRFCISPDYGVVFMEPEFSLSIQNTLKQMGHKIKILEGYARYIFGRGQIIQKSLDKRLILTGGCDPRSDGQTVGY